MRIAHAIFSFKVGGAENMLIDIMNLQVEMGYEVTLIIINNEINYNLLNLINKKIKIILIQRPLGSKNIYYILKLYILLYLNKINIIHCHSEALGKILKYCKIKKLITIHDTGKSSIYLNYFDILISISNAVKIDLQKNGGFESIVIHNGIHTNVINTKNIQSRQTIKILQISRLVHEKKGQDLLLDAMFTIVNKLNYTNVKCYFIGEGESEKYLKTYVKKLSLEKNIIFLGLKDRKYIYENLCTFDLLIQPSRYEGFGLTIVEAMAARVPVLVSDIEGPLEVIRNGELGSYFKNENVNDLCNQMLSIINNNGTNKIELAYKFTVENYDIKHTVQKYIKIYKDLL